MKIKKMDKIENYYRIFLVTILIAGMIPLTSCVENQSAQVIKIAEMSWISNVPIINIMKIILEDKLNYEVEFIPTLYAEPTLSALTKNPPEVDIFADCWQQNFQTLIDEYVINEKKGEIVSLSYLAPQGFVVPTYLIKGDPARGIAPLAPDLYSVEQLNDYIHLFDRNKDGSGDLIGGPEGWNATKINEWQLESWGLNFHQLTQDEWVSSSLLIAAYQEGEPILSYFYEPTWQSSQLDLTWLEAPEYNDEAWSDFEIWEKWKMDQNVSWQPGKACAYPETKVVVVVTSEFKKKYPKAYQFLQNWSIPLEDLKELCYKIEIERLPVNYVASTYVKEHPEMVNRWLKGIK